jgi:hypothetical protein
MRRTWTTLAGVVALLAAMLTVAPAASADTYGCAGSQIDAYRLFSADRGQYGMIYLFYDASSGKNCAVTVAALSGGYGVYKPMAVQIDVCRERLPTSCTVINSVEDSGTYKYWAGPRSVAAAGHCIRVYGRIVFQGDTAVKSVVGHCD